MKYILAFTLLIIVYQSNAQNERSKAIAYIQDYYEQFETGYDFDGKSITLSKNYKATFSDSVFTLTFDQLESQNQFKQVKIVINFNQILRIEPYGTDVVEIQDHDPYMIPITGKLAFITENQIHEINIYYEVDEDVELSTIFLSFDKLIKLNQGQQ